MPGLDRRSFLSRSLAGLAVAGLGSAVPGRSLLADGKDAEQPDPYETLFLTWQRDPTTTMTVQWIGSPASDQPVIQYRPASDSLWQLERVFAKPFPGTDQQVFRCELTGLKPGADYEFQIGTSSPLYRFRTMPAKATNEFRFVSGGDAGTGTAAKASNVLAAKQDPCFVLMGGDLAYDNGRSPETFLKFLRNYHAAMFDSQERLIPMLSCLGNHEVDNNQQDRRRGAATYLSVFDGLFSETSYATLDFGDYLSLVLLDTSHISPAAGEQTDWLESTLAARADHPHVFVAHHVPCYPSVREPFSQDGKAGTGEAQRKHWCPLFERYKVNAVLEHHDHAFKRSHPLTDGRIDERTGIYYLGDGSWGKIRRPKPPEERPYLAKVSESFHISLHQLEGDRRFHVAITDGGRVADIVSTRGNRPSL